jgi:hypothetical protein
LEMNSTGAPAVAPAASTTTAAVDQDKVYYSREHLAGLHSHLELLSALTHLGISTAPSMTVLSLSV